MSAEPGIEAFEEVAGVVVKAEGGDGDLASVGFDGVVARREPKVMGEWFGCGEG